MEPWLAHTPPKLLTRRTESGTERRGRDDRYLEGHRSASNAPARTLAAALSRWMSEKQHIPADWVKCFFLTSPFIEPAHRLAQPTRPFSLR